PARRAGADVDGAGPAHAVRLGLHVAHAEVAAQAVPAVVGLHVQRVDVLGHRPGVGGEGGVVEGAGLGHGLPRRQPVAAEDPVGQGPAVDGEALGKVAGAREATKVVARQRARAELVGGGVAVAGHRGQGHAAHALGGLVLAALGAEADLVDGRVKADAEVDLAVPLLVAGRLEHDVAAPAGVPGRRAGRVAAPAAVDLE